MWKNTMETAPPDPSRSQVLPTTTRFDLQQRISTYGKESVARVAVGPVSGPRRRRGGRRARCARWPQESLPGLSSGPERAPRGPQEGAKTPPASPNWTPLPPQKSPQEGSHKPREDPGRARRESSCGEQIKRVTQDIQARGSQLFRRKPQAFFWASPPWPRTPLFRTPEKYPY